MNNNRGNNRRRGRSSNNRQSGNQQQANRIDSRARGNAPQLLEKYRKLAHDAHLNGDRVNAEYYLQFADHYFRVIADIRLRQEESRQRREERWQDGDSERADMDERDDTGRSADSRAAQGAQHGDADPSDAEAASDGNAEREAGQQAESAGAGEAERSSKQVNPYEPAENPFVRDNRGPSAPRQRRPRRAAAPVAEDEQGEADSTEASDSSDSDSQKAEAVISKPVRARRTTARKSVSNSDDAGTESAPDAAAEDDAASEAKPRRRVQRAKRPATRNDEELQQAS